MAEILMKAGSFIAIIILGYVLRRRGFFKEEDFYVLSRIVLKITLPAAIVTNFTGIDMKPSMLLMSLLGLGGGIILTGMAFLISAGKNGEEKAFNIINLTGYNIGNFTMPFAQSFLGPLGVVATSLFDSGNSLVCLGGTYSVAVMAKGEKGKFSIMPIKMCIRDRIERMALAKRLVKHFGDSLAISEAVNGAEALKVFKREQSQIVLMDISMPEMNGAEAAEQIRGMDEDCIIIFLPAYDDFAYAKRAIVIRALDYLLKPCDEDELVSVIEEAMRCLLYTSKQHIYGLTADNGRSACR